MLAQGIILVAPEYAGMNMMASIWLLVIAGYVFIVYGIYPLYHPMQKRLLLALGLACIIIGHSIFINNIEQHIYASDMVRLFGVLIVWFGATGIFTNTSTIQSQKREKTIEIIEA